MLRPLKIVYEYFALYSSLTLLGLICLSWSVFALPLFYILPQRLGTAVGRRGIMSGFRIYAWSLSITRAYRLDLRDIDSLKGGPPLILAPNHPCLIDALLILTRHPNIVCVMKVGAHEKCVSRFGLAPRPLRQQRLIAPDGQGIGGPSAQRRQSCCCFPRAPAPSGNRSTSWSAAWA